MSKKKRLPIAQLRESARIANEMAKKKGLIAEESVIDKLSKDKNAPVLPGLPAYLPHVWTLTACEIALYNMSKDWLDLNKKSPRKAENIVEFSNFVFGEFKKLEVKYKQEKKEMGKIIKKIEDSKPLSDIFSSVRKASTTKAISKFFVDSLVVAHLAEKDSTTFAYVDWFLNDWSPKLKALWENKNEKIIHDSASKTFKH